MPCIPFNEGGARGFMCTSGRAKRCACGVRATLECDWKVQGKRSGACDRPICVNCSHKPASGKDLCPDHATIWKARSA